MTYGSLFSGIGGLDLAVEAFGHTPLWQAESDPYARAVLAKHWPAVHCYRDVREINDAAERPDIICGGFPCQDISNAGKRVGIDGERSGLWSEFARIIRALRPRFVFVENVAALTVRGLDRVLGDLAALGFDAEWDVLRAADVGAPHLRARIFILAYAQRADLREQQGRSGWTGWPGEAQPGEHGVSWPLADAHGTRPRDPEDARSDCGDEGAGEAAKGWRTSGCEESERGGPVADASGGRFRAGLFDLRTRESDSDRCGQALADSDGGGREGERRTERDSGEAGVENARGHVTDGRSREGALADAGGETGRPSPRLSLDRDGAGTPRQRAQEPGRRFSGLRRWGYWDVEPDVGRVVARLPTGVDGRGTGLGRGSKGIGGGRDRANRLRCLGNAVVWQQAALALETLTARARQERAA